MTTIKPMYRSKRTQLTHQFKITIRRVFRHRRPRPKTHKTSHTRLNSSKRGDRIRLRARKRARTGRKLKLRNVRFMLRGTKNTRHITRAILTRKLRRRARRLRLNKALPRSKQYIMFFRRMLTPQSRKDSVSGTGTRSFWALRAQFSSCYYQIVGSFFSRRQFLSAPADERSYSHTHGVRFIKVSKRKRMYRWRFLRNTRFRFYRLWFKKFRKTLRMRRLRRRYRRRFVYRQVYRFKRLLTSPSTKCTHLRLLHLNLLLSTNKRLRTRGQWRYTAHKRNEHPYLFLRKWTPFTKPFQMGLIGVMTHKWKHKNRRPLRYTRRRARRWPRRLRRSRRFIKQKRKSLSYVPYKVRVKGSPRRRRLPAKRYITTIAVNYTRSRRPLRRRIRRLVVGKVRLNSSNLVIRPINPPSLLPYRLRSINQLTHTIWGTKTSLNVTKLSSVLRFTSKKRMKFIFVNIGLFITSRFNFFKISILNKPFKFKFKKKYHSFLQPNFLKKSIMIKKRKIVIARFFRKFKWRVKTHTRPKSSFKSLLTKFRNFLPNCGSGKLQHINPFYANRYNTITRSYKPLIHNYNDSDRYGEVRIRRVKFKPGYQRIWRQVRGALKEALHLKYAYQYRLTRYLMRFSRKANPYLLGFSEFSIERTVMYAKLLPDKNSFLFFLSSKLIYYNGILSHHSLNLVRPNGIIQIVISKWYYTLYRWLANWTCLRVKKFRKLVYRKGRPSRYKLMKRRKQRSKYTPNWIFNVRYDLNDVKPYLEVDYFTLSVMFIYEPYFISVFPIHKLAENRTHIYRLYNWKYIT
jgi:hypothetical protein